MLAGNVVALLSPCIFVPALTYAFGPQNYDYKSMAAIRLANDGDVAEASHMDIEHIQGAAAPSSVNFEYEKKKLQRASLIAKSLTGFMTLALIILWPMPMYGSGYIFSKKFFTGWVSVGILWMFCSAFCVGLYPLFEGRHSMANTFKGILKDLSGKSGAATLHGREGSGSEESTPTAGDYEKAAAVVSEKKE